VTQQTPADGGVYSFAYRVTNGMSTQTADQPDAAERHCHGIRVQRPKVNQLTSLTYLNGQTTLGDLTYTYDLAGQRVAVDGSWARTLPPQPVPSASYDAANELTAWGGQALAYDPNGNLTSNGMTSYTWNARNQLSALSGGMVASFQYDGLRRRQSKTIGGTTAGFLDDGLTLVQDLSGSTPASGLLTGSGIDETFTRADAGGTSSFLLDALGSALALADASGTVHSQYTFDPFGAATLSGMSTPNPFQFTGRENDGTGLYFYRARFYSPAAQRFVSEDPIEFLGGLNLYEYAGSNPIRYRDPLEWSRNQDCPKMYGHV
jgi:RHS repeat-associated protein